MKCAFRCFLLRTCAAAAAILTGIPPLAGDEPAPQIEQQAADQQELIRQEKVLSDLQSEFTRLYGVRLAAVAAAEAGAETQIGLSVAPADDVLRSHLGLAEGKGLVVTNVTENSAAAQAGLQANDVLTSVGDEDVDGVDKLRQLLEAYASQPVSLSLLRSGRRQAVNVTPQPADGLEVQVSNDQERKYWLGVGLAAADDTLRAQLGVPAGEGLVVTGIESDSPAARAGLMANDLLLKLDGRPLKTIEELSQQLQEIKDQSATLELRRRGKPATLTVTPELRPQGVARVETGLSWLLFANQLGEANDLITLRAAMLGGGANLQIASQVDALVEQSKQLQASLEALQASIKAQHQAPEGGDSDK